MESIGMDLCNCFLWDKRKYNNQTIFGSYPYPPNFYSHLSYEYINVFRKPGKTKEVSKEIKDGSKLTMEEWRQCCIDVFWDISPTIKFGKDGEVRGHDAPFPIEIPRRLMRLFSFIGDTVFDPFLGSGTTLAACAIEERNGIGFELNPEYENLIKLALRNPSKKAPTYKKASNINGYMDLSKII
jgi:DNA modification methylase